MGAREIETETIYGEVVGKANNYMAVPDKDGNRRIIKNEKIRAYERNFASQCKVYRGRMIAKPFIFYARVFFTHNGHDLDNSLKTILDCLQYANAITDDNLCVKIVAEKHIDKRVPRVQYAIQETQPTLF